MITNLDLNLNKEKNFIRDTVNYLQSLPKFVILKDTLKLLKYIIQQIENANFSKKIDKKEIVIKILIMIFPDINLKIIDEQLDTLIESDLISV